jgi:acetyl-CoA synthetase
MGRIDDVINVAGHRLSTTTRSGKIMRRLLKNIAEGKPLDDTTTLRDPAIVEGLQHQADRALGGER